MARNLHSRESIMYVITCIFALPVIYCKLILLHLSIINIVLSKIIKLKKKNHTLHQLIIFTSNLVFLHQIWCILQKI